MDKHELLSRGLYPRKLDQRLVAGDQQIMKSIYLDFINARGLLGWSTLPSDFCDREHNARQMQSAVRQASSAQVLYQG